MRYFWMLVLSLWAVAIATAQAQSVSTTMQVTMNVIPDCSVSVDYDKDHNHHEQHQIRCSGDSPHRVYYHRRNKYEEAQDAYVPSEPQRYHNALQKRERDNDAVVWLTTEF